MTVVAIIALLSGLTYIVLSKPGTWLLSPYPQNCLFYAIWFSRPLEVSAENARVEVVNILGFAVFSLVYLSLERHAYTKSIAAKLLALAHTSRRWIPKPLNSSLCNVAVAVLVILSGGFLLVNGYYYGSLEGSLVRFRSGMGDQPVPVVIRSLEGLLIAILLAFVMITHVDCLIHQRLMQFWRPAIVALCYLALTLPTGTGGYLIGLGLSLVTSVFVGRAVIGHRVRVSMRSIAILFVLSAIAFVQLHLRERTFTGIQDVIDVVIAESNTMGSDVIKSGSDYQAGMNVFVLKALDTYHDESEFLWFYTYYSIAVNWIPRLFWESKPVGMGRVIVTETPHSPVEAAYSTVSYSVALGLAGEGWINGGYVGIVMLAIFTGTLCAILASCFYQSLVSGSYFMLSLGLLCRIAATNFVRGDWLSAWASFMLPLLCLYGVAVIAKQIKRHLLSPANGGGQR